MYGKRNAMLNDENKGRSSRKKKRGKRRKTSRKRGKKSLSSNFGESGY